MLVLHEGGQLEHYSPTHGGLWRQWWRKILPVGRNSNRIYDCTLCLGGEMARVQIYIDSRAVADGLAGWSGPWRLVTRKSWTEIRGWTPLKRQNEDTRLPCQCLQRAVTAEKTLNDQVDKFLCSVEVGELLYTAATVLAPWDREWRGHAAGSEDVATTELPLQRLSWLMLLLSARSASASDSSVVSHRNFARREYTSLYVKLSWLWHLMNSLIKFY